MRNHLVFFGTAIFLLAGSLPAQEQSQPGEAIQPQEAGQSTIESPRPYTSDGQPSVALFYWLSPVKPKMRTGEAAIEGANANLDFPRKSEYSPSVMLSLPAGNQHTIRISYFQTIGQGNTTAPHDLSIFGVGYSPGDYLSTGYKLQNAKISLDYLSWPFPVNYGGLRIKTFWEVQYTNIRFALDAPLKPKTDEDENPIFNDTTGSHWFLYPTFGMGLQKSISRNFRVEAKASGFALPNRPRLVDAEAFGAFRSGQFEVMVGAKAFHFRTTPREDQFMTGTLSGAFVGMRWYP